MIGSKLATLRQNLIKYNSGLSVLILLWCATLLFFAFLKPAFFDSSTFSTILQFCTILALVALGQSLVILSGGAGIDLSVGGIVSLVAILSLITVKSGISPNFIPLLCIVFGLILGAVNATLVVWFRIFPLIATLGTFFVYSGLALALTGGTAQTGIPDGLLNWGRGMFFTIPFPFLTLVLPLFGCVWLFLSSTIWGRWIYALGYNENSARLVGINVDRIRFVIYAISGLFSGTAALLSIAWLGSARPNIGQNLELESLTAVMLGGFAITGGIGRIWGVLAAVILIVTLKTGLLQLNVNTIWQAGIVGLLLIITLIITRFSKAQF